MDKSTSRCLGEFEGGTEACEGLVRDGNGCGRVSAHLWEVPGKRSC
jgi:hypothetical protein